MKLLIDAHLPRRVAGWFEQEGHDVVHTFLLADGNATQDSELKRLCRAEDRVMVSKDADFVDGHLLRRDPERLLLLSFGNLGNRELEMCLRPRIHTIMALFEAGQSFIEVAALEIYVRDV